MMSAYRDFDFVVVDALNFGASYYLKKLINLREEKEIIKKFEKICLFSFLRIGLFQDVVMLLLFLVLCLFILL